jgi:diguanylate cyclase (GGDEF)-like protein
MTSRPDQSRLNASVLGAESAQPARDDRRAPGTDDGSADLAAELAEMGLSPKASWYSSAVLYLVGGLLITGLYAIDRTAFQSGVFYLGCIAVVIGVLCALAGKHLHDSNRILEVTTHARLVAGFAIFLTAVLITHDRVIAFALIPLLIVPTPCYLYTWRMALPYVLGGALLVFLAQLPIAGPARVAHALISTCAFAVIAAALIVTKQRTRLLARHNRNLAYIDPLTGISNMRGLRECISASAAPGASSADEAPFALYAIDMDNFKQVNDQFDHSMGDTVLSAIAAAIRDELGPNDLAVRRGGDEFAVLVPDPSTRDLEGLCDSLERAIARARIATCPQITPSGTVAYIRTEPGEELGSMMERADEALHHAKLASRNRRSEEAPALAEPLHTRGIGAEPVVSGGPQLSTGVSEATGSERARSARVLPRGLTAALARANPDWIFAALLLFLGALATASVSAAQLVEPLTPLAGGAIAAGSLALALGCAWAGMAGVSPRWLHLPWLASYGLLALQIHLAGPAGAALLDLIPAIVMYGFLVFKARTAALYLLLGQGMYGAFAIGGGFDQGVARTVVTTVVVAVVGGLVSKLRLVTVSLARTNSELSELDALTGVGNLRALRGRVSDAVERASSGRYKPLAVAIDLDEFKQVNDVYSHSTGDQVLVAVARAVSERVRIDALVARRGGDEFVVVLDDADPQYTAAVVQRIDDAIVRARRRICPDLRSTASVASVEWQPGETAGDFLHGVDVALHHKKAEAHALRRTPASAEAPTAALAAAPAGAS